MSKETVNHESQPNAEEFDYVHEQLFSAMHEIFERLNAVNGEVVSITKEGAQGHFFYFSSPEQTISEICLTDNTLCNNGTKHTAHVTRQLSKHLLLEIDRTRCFETDAKRLRYHQFDPNGAEHIIDVNPIGELQYESTWEVDGLTMDLDGILEDFKLLERPY